MHLAGAARWQPRPGTAAMAPPRVERLPETFVMSPVTSALPAAHCRSFRWMADPLRLAPRARMRRDPQEEWGFVVPPSSRRLEPASAVPSPDAVGFRPVRDCPDWRR